MIWGKLLKPFSLYMSPAAVEREIPFMQAESIEFTVNCEWNLQWRRALISIAKHSLHDYGAYGAMAPKINLNGQIPTRHGYDHTQWPSWSELYDFVNTCRRTRARCMFWELLQIAPANKEDWMASKKLRNAQLTTTPRTTYIKQSIGTTTVVISLQSMHMLCDDWCVVQFSSN